MKNLWERACSRRGRHRRDICRLPRRLRELARSHRVCVAHNLWRQAHSAMRALCGRLCRFARWTVMTRCSGSGVLTVSFVRLQEFSCV
ncbi:hypothetical protein C3E98_008695 [Pseudomonas sp. MWU13-2625]|nr:hypothetical protein C3E98_008695 [Pseudomonas sp. MWU13-2625]